MSDLSDRSKPEALLLDKTEAENIPDIYIDLIGYGCPSDGFFVIPRPYAVECTPPSL